MVQRVDCGVAVTNIDFGSPYPSSVVLPRKFGRGELSAATMEVALRLKTLGIRARKYRASEGPPHIPSGIAKKQASAAANVVVRSPCTST